jgi:tripartite-type tricarboxylate transporter receptor subunit TctC
LPGEFHCSIAIALLTSMTASAQTYPTRAPSLVVPYAADVVKIPSCRSCNEGASMDDEYFKTIMVLKEGAGSHPKAVIE